MKEMSINENEVRTLLTVLYELRKKSYSDLNNYLGSLTIEEMYEVNRKLNDWYQSEINGLSYDEEYGWYDPNMPFG